MEKDIGSLGPVSGHTYDTIYNLLFTTKRAIAMILQHPLDRPEKITMAALFIGDRPTQRNNRIEKLKLEEERIQHYKEKTFDEMVSDNRFNFEITYDHISGIELTRGLFQSRLIFHTSGREANMRQKIKFTFSKKQLPEAERILHKVLPSKINTPPN